MTTATLYTPAFFADPFPTYHTLRDQGPVVRDGHTWLVTRHAHIKGVAHDSRLRKGPVTEALVAALPPAAREAAAPFSDSIARNMLRVDPPDHTRLRGLVSKAFTPRTAEALSPRIERLVAELLDAVAPAGGMDVIQDFAYPLPATVIMEMLGIPPEDRDRFKAWSDDQFAFLGGRFPGDPLEPARRAGQSTLAMNDYLRGLIAERRRAPRADLISAMVAVEEQGDRLTEQELVATADLLLGAGHETTTHLIGNGLLALLRDREQMQRLQQEPALMPTAVEELLRYDGPVQFVNRVPAADIDIGGVTIPAGDTVMLMLAAANRDPAQFPGPDHLDIARRPNDHLGFGFDRHFCLGAHLVRVEIQIALGALLTRFPNLTLAADADSLEWQPNPLIRGLRSLPVYFSRPRS
jgi:cytochrome P450